MYGRARGRCEYCLVPEAVTFIAHQIDHVIGRKHGGPSTPGNLALSCALCNRRKGSDIGSIDPETGDLVPLFNPRRDLWSQHFAIRGDEIAGLTARGRATVEFLQFNTFQRRLERAALLEAGLLDTEPDGS